MEKPFVAGTQIIQPAFTITPFSPPSSLRRGYDRQAGPVTGSFNGLHWESKFLAINLGNALRSNNARPT
jgi:hypothetical protein